MSTETVRSITVQAQGWMAAYLPEDNHCVIVQSPNGEHFFGTLTSKGIQGLNIRFEFETDQVAVKNLQDQLVAKWWTE